METIIIAALVGVLGVVFGYSVGSTKLSDDIVPLDWRDREIENERRRNQVLQEELEFVKRSCRFHHQPPFLGCDGCHHTTRYFAQTIEQQRMADMLARAKDTATQLVKDLSA